MRVLFFKINFLFIAFFFVSIEASAYPNLQMLYKSFLENSVKAKSLKFLTRQQQNLDRSQIDWQSFQATYEGEFIRNEGMVPQSPQKQLVNSLGLKHQNSLGLDLSLEYQDSYTLPSTTSSFGVTGHESQLSLTIESRVLKDLLGQKRKSQKQLLASQLALREEQNKDTLMNEFIASLQMLANIYRDQKILEETNKQCILLQQQERSFRRLYKSGSRSLKDYLLSQKSSNSCQISQKQSQNNIEKQYILVKQLYYPKLELKTLNNLIDKSFSQMQKTYKNYREIDSPNFRSLENLERQKKLQKQNLNIAKLDARSDLKLGLFVGLKGVDSSFQKAHKDLAKTDKAFYGVKLSFDWPPKNKERYHYNGLLAEDQYLTQEYKLQKQKLQIELTNVKNSIIQLEKELRVLNKQWTLSQKIFRESHKEFRRGQIEFFELIKDQENILTSLDLQARRKVQLLSHYIIALDAYRFFEKDEFLNRSASGVQTKPRERL